MASISLPTPSGTRKTRTVRAGVSLEAVLRQEGAAVGAHRWGVERKTPGGWVPVPTSHIVQAGDELRVRTPTPTVTPRTNPLQGWLLSFFSNLERRRK